MFSSLIQRVAEQIHTVFRFGRLCRTAFGAYKFQITLMTVLSFMSGMLEGVGINAIIPLFSFLGGASGAPTDSISLFIARFFSFLHFPYTARTVLMLMVIVFLAKALFLLLSQYVTALITTDFEKKTRQKLLVATFGAAWPFLAAQKVGHLDQLLTTDVSASASILTYMSSLILTFANLLIYTYLVFNLSSSAALLAFLFGLLIFIGFKPLLSKTKRLSDAMVKRYKDIAHFSTEHIIGAKVIKSMHVEEAALSRGVLLLDEMRKLSVKTAFLRNIVPSLLQLLGVFFIVGLFVFLYKTASFQFAAFAVVVYALSKVFANLQFVQTNMHAISMQVPYLESVLGYQTAAGRAREEERGGVPFQFRKEIRMEQVDFRYASAGPHAIVSASFSIAKGEITGLIGPSGSGKTTIVDLLLRLILPDGGRITVDGKDISSVSLAEWRTRVAYVPQDVFLLNDTIENNIKLYDSSITDAKMREAAKMADIYDFITAQPKRFQTPSGERGITLSGGQRQRIALARALAREPEILILDEATSALDHESEAAIQKAVERLRGRVTVVIIAHRLSTINIADTLVVIDSGRVLETGSPASLREDRTSYFARLYARAA